jgi:IS30 family transposase
LYNVITTKTFTKEKVTTMSLIHITTNSTKNKHLTEIERYKIEAYLKDNKKAWQIAQLLGKSERTIQREIKRGTVILLDTELREYKTYCADTAQRKYDENAANKGRNYKIGNDHELAGYIERMIVEEKYSPDAVIGRIRLEGKFQTSICTKTLYNYIDSGLFLHLTNKDLPVKKEGKRRIYRKAKVALKNLKGTSIEERPDEIENRDEYGHWEMDCVVGGQNKGKAVLLVLSERKSREEIIFKMTGKTQECVKKALDSLEKKHGYERFVEMFKTITVDNGSEFLDFGGIEKSIKRKKKNRTKVYYAHPFSSWERGTNENTNKLIRRFIPKGSSIDDVTPSMIKYIENWLNNYPRRILGYRTPNEVKIA